NGHRLSPITIEEIQRRVASITTCLSITPLRQRVVVPIRAGVLSDLAERVLRPGKYRRPRAAANCSLSGSNTIALVAGNAFTLTAVGNSTDGPTGLPVIAAHDNLTILGNGDTVARSPKGIPAFRLFAVAGGAGLALENLTLQGGLAVGKGVS